MAAPTRRAMVTSIETSPIAPKKAPEVHRTGPHDRSHTAILPVWFEDRVIWAPGRVDWMKAIDKPSPDSMRDTAALGILRCHWTPSS